MTGRPSVAHPTPLVIDGVRFESRALRINLEEVGRVFAFVITCGNELEQAALVPGDRSTFTQHRFRGLVEAEGHPARAFGTIMADACAALGMRGPVAFFGDLGAGFVAAKDQHLSADEIRANVPLRSAGPRRLQRLWTRVGGTAAPGGGPGEVRTDR